VIERGGSRKRGMEDSAMKGRWLLPLLPLLITLGDPLTSLSQEQDQLREIEALQKRLQDSQRKSSGPAQGSLKRRDLKGQPLSSQGEMEGFTPEERKMYEELQRQLGEIKENVKKRDAALEELSR
jgi:hypothetical protein